MSCRVKNAEDMEISFITLPESDEGTITERREHFQPTIYFGTVLVDEAQVMMALLPFNQ